MTIQFIFEIILSNHGVHVQHIRKYLPELLSLISELWSSFSLPAANRPVHGSPVSVASKNVFIHLLFHIKKLFIVVFYF